MIYLSVLKKKNQKTKGKIVYFFNDEFDFPL